MKHDVTVITCNECQHCFEDRKSRTGYSCEVWGYDEFADAVPLDGWCFKAKQSSKPIISEEETK